MSLIAIVLVGLVTLSAAIPIIQPEKTVAQTLGKRELIRKRGIAYNNPAYVKFFDIPNSKIFWKYSTCRRINHT
jgi:hypothetical protein